MNSIYESLVEALLYEDMNRLKPQHPFFIKVISYDPDNFSIDITLDRQSEKKVMEIIEKHTKKYKIAVPHRDTEVFYMKILDIEL